MNDSSTAQATGATVADAAERIESLLSSADSETDETQEADEASNAAEDDPEQSEDPEDGEQSDAEDEPDEADEQPELYTVKVAGEEVQVTLEEALKGYSREQDYTRKTQALAEENKAKQAAAAAARDEYLNGLQTVQKIIEASQPKVDQNLRYTNPAEWSAQMLQHQQWAEQRRGVAAEAERLKGEQAQEEARERETLAARETEALLTVLPEWKDPAVAKAETAALREYGQSIGFTEAELDDVLDHRAVRVLRDAMAYRTLKAKSGQVRSAVEAKKVAKPGATSAPPSKHLDLQRAKQRLRQSGRVDDAAAAIERLLG
jgi:hypothetical protein